MRKKEQKKANRTRFCCISPAIFACQFRCRCMYFSPLPESHKSELNASLRLLYMALRSNVVTEVVINSILLQIYANLVLFWIYL